jgi:BRCA1-associated RING domain protein 1
VTPFPESETPTRPKKIMKSDEQKRKEDKDNTLNSDIPDNPSLSPFFWLKEQEENVGGTAETLSEPLSLDTALCHNVPTFSDIKDSDDEMPNDMTPNVSYFGHVLFLFFFLGFPVQLLCSSFGYMLQSKVEVSELFDSEIFEWSQRPCSPELRSTPLKKQVFFVNGRSDTEALHF